MEKIFSLVLALLLLFSKITAQNNLPSAYEIRTDTILEQPLDSSHWQFMGDEKGMWTIQDVSNAPLSNKFHSLIVKTNNADTIVRNYWFRYLLKNAIAHRVKICLNSMSDYDDFYIAGNNGKWGHYITGNFVQWDKKDGLKAANCIPLIFDSGETFTIYQRISNSKPGLPEGFQISISSFDKIIQQSYIDDVHGENKRYSAIELQEMFVEGVLLLAIFINLLFYKVVREKEYLYFSLFLLFLGVDRLINLLGNFLSTEHPGSFQYYGYINLSWVFILLFLVMFTRSFFKLQIKYPGFDKFLIISAIAAGIFNVSATFTVDPCFMCGGAFPTPYLIYSIMTFVTCFSVLIVFFLFARGKNKFNKLVIIGGWPLMFVWGVGQLAASSATFAYLKYGAKIDWTWFLYFRPIEVVCIIWFVFFFSLILFMRFTQLRKDNAQQALDKERMAREKEIEKNELIEKQKVDLEIQVSERTSDLKQSIQDLKSTQHQLIQAEKMASLGELTAGIAHEIQNPLNFVNNFSEVSNELISELQEERHKEQGTRDEQMQDEILNDIKQNLEKINHHGKRADAIVKGMLQHSRSSTGVKEPTNINNVADEYLRLAYHGLRAKDKDFNSTLKTDFDNSIEKINIIPQDIGRVLLNLYNNAFYAVNERRKVEGEGYDPTVSVTTKKSGSRISISVSDNGNGIPQKIVDKIFQPFFTTKPTGQGTGLGLSLSYDIIKAHGGEIKVETKECEAHPNDPVGWGTEFIIQLPIQ